MQGITKTIAQINFEDLDPKRFEDLIRQLLYDFRVWRVLEPTGRSGSDDGFDARGFEANRELIEPLADDNDEDDPTDPLPVIEDRQWLVQCKRERQITPRALLNYLEQLVEDERRNL